MISFLTGNPLAFFAAVYVLSQSTVTIGENHTGVVFRGDHYVGQLPTGGHYRLPWIDCVIELNTSVSYGKTLNHDAALASHQRCDFSVDYWYTVSNPDQAAEHAQFTKFGRLEPISIENGLRREIETFAGEISIETINRGFEHRLERHLEALRLLAFEDGTKFDGVGSSKMTCSDPVAAKAIEVAKRPLYQVGPSRPFANLNQCGEPDQDTRKRELSPYSVYRQDNAPVDLSDIRLHYRIVGETSWNLDQAHTLEAFASNTLFNAFINVADEDIAMTNLCSVLLDDPRLTTLLAEHGIELVALDPFTPQYAIHERIEYDDDPAD